MIKSGCIMRRYDRPVEIAGRVEPYGCDDVDDRQHPGLADDRDDFPSWGRDDPAYQVPMGRPKYDDRVKTGYTHGRDDFPSQGRDDPAPMGQPKYDGHVWCGYGTDDFPSQGRDDRASQVPMVRPKYDDRVYLSHTDRRDDFPSQGRNNPTSQVRMGHTNYVGNDCEYVGHNDSRDNFRSCGRDDLAHLTPVDRQNFVNDDLVCSGNISDRDGFPSWIRDGRAPQVLLGQPNQLPYRQPIDPETYDGKTSVEEYLKRFEQIADWNRWDDVEAAIQLSLHLKGSAKRIVKTLPEDQRRSYNHMWSILNSTFGENVNVMALQEEFWRRTKQPEERIPEFAIHLESIAKKAFSEFLLDRTGEKALEQLIVERFIAGVAVGNDPMGRYIHLQHPSSLQQAVSLAQHYHAYDEMNPLTQQQSEDQVYNIQEDGLNVDDITKEVKSLAQEVRSMMSGPAEAETDKKIIQRTKAEVNSMRQELTELKLMVAIQKQEISHQCNLISANANAIDELKQMRSQEQCPYVQPETNLGSTRKGAEGSVNPSQIPWTIVDLMECLMMMLLQIQTMRPTMIVLHLRSMITVHAMMSTITILAIIYMTTIHAMIFFRAVQTMMSMTIILDMMTMIAKMIVISVMIRMTVLSLTSKMTV